MALYPNCDMFEEKLWYQQDGASPHNAFDVQRYLDDVFSHNEYIPYFMSTLWCLINLVDIRTTYRITSLNSITNSYMKSYQITLAS